VRLKKSPGKVLKERLAGESQDSSTRSAQFDSLSNASLPNLNLQMTPKVLNPLKKFAEHIMQQQQAHMGVKMTTSASGRSHNS